MDSTEIRRAARLLREWAQAVRHSHRPATGETDHAALAEAAEMAAL